jgi:hypothetical protein
MPATTGRAAFLSRFPARPCASCAAAPDGGRRSPSPVPPCARPSRRPGCSSADRAITPTSSARRYNTRFLIADGALAGGDLAGDGELEDLAWRNEDALRHLGLVDVTAFVLEEALACWQNPHKVPPPALLSYRSDVVRLRRARPTG